MGRKCRYLRALRMKRRKRLNRTLPVFASKLGYNMYKRQDRSNTLRYNEHTKCIRGTL